MTEQASRTYLNFLFDLLTTASDGLPGVTHKRMFGCDSLFAKDNIYALIWRTGRIGLRITDKQQYDELLAQPGAEVWAIDDKPMSHWVLVPEDFHDDSETLSEWVRQAHSMAAAAPPKVPKKKQNKT